MRHFRPHVFAASAMLVWFAATMAAGCGCKPRTTMQSLAVTVERAPELNDRLVKVALFGARDPELSEWRTRSAAELTRPADLGDYESATQVLYLPADGPNTTTLPRDSDLWKRWRARGAWTLVAVADVPGGRSADRRETITLDACDWEKIGDKRLVLNVHPDGIRVAQPSAFADQPEQASAR